MNVSFAKDGPGETGGCEHGDYSEESGPDSPDTDSGTSHGPGSSR